jgi:hypothetical protein
MLKKLIDRLTIYGDKDRRLEVGPWSLNIVAYAVAVFLWRELAGVPFANIDCKRALATWALSAFI